MTELDDTAKVILRRLHTWGDYWSHTARESTNQDDLDALSGLERDGCMECRWGDPIYFHLTPKGHLVAIALEEGE